MGLLVKSLLDLLEREIPTLPILDLIANIVLYCWLIMMVMMDVAMSRNGVVGGGLEKIQLELKWFDE